MELRDFFFAGKYALEDESFVFSTTAKSYFTFFEAPGVEMTA